MTRVGRYSAAYEGVTGSLFVYGEAPVTSTKLNRWDGNIDAGFWLVHRALRLLAGTDEAPRVIGPDASEPLRVREQAAPDLTVRVLPGILIGSAYLAGLSETESLPIGAAFSPPTGNPRIDSIGILESGDWVIVAGAEGVSPVAPGLPAGAVRLADVYLRVGASAIRDSDDSSQAYLIDRRPPQIACRAHQHTSPLGLVDVVIEGSLDAAGPVEFGDSAHTFSVFQPASEGAPATNSPGTPEVLYNAQENHWCPRQAAMNAHVSFACPLNSSGTRIKEVKLVLRLVSSTERFNAAVLSRSSQAPESLIPLVDFAAEDYADEDCTSVGDDYYNFVQTLGYTLPSNSQVWVSVYLSAGSYGPDCRLLGLEWTFEERRY